MNKLEGLIFKTQSYSESSRLLHTYTPKGKVALLAKGAQRLKSNDRILAQYLTQISFEYKNFKGFMPLYSGVIINDYEVLKSDYDKVKFASIILEILDKTAIANENYEAIYQLAINSLNFNNIEISSLSFATKLLYHLGFGINLKSDGRKIKGVSIKMGSIIYEDDIELVDLSYDDAINLLKLTYITTNKLEEFPKKFLQNIKGFLYLYYAYHLNISIKALQ